MLLPPELSSCTVNINNASNEYHRDLVFDAPARMVGRFENFLRDAARDHAPCCGKGQRIVAPAIFKTFSKNARIGDRSGYRAFRSLVKMPESGTDPATVRFEVE